MFPDLFGGGPGTTPARMVPAPATTRRRRRQHMSPAARKAVSETDAQRIGRSAGRQASQLMPPRAAIVLIFIAACCSARGIGTNTTRPAWPYVIDLRGATSGSLTSISSDRSPRHSRAISGVWFRRRRTRLCAQGRLARVGLGANIVRVRGRPQRCPGHLLRAARRDDAAVFPDVASVFTTVAPQVSFQISAPSTAGVSQRGCRARLHRNAVPPRLREPTRSRLCKHASSVRHVDQLRRRRPVVPEASVAFGFDVRFHAVTAGMGRRSAHTGRKVFTAPSGYRCGR